MKNKSLTFKIVLGVIVVIIITVAFLIRGANGDGNSEKITVERDSIAEIVRITGKIVPAQDAELGFEVSGTVEQVNLDVGDSVQRGQVIATLDTDQLYAELTSAQAQLAADQASLEDIQNGTRPEEIAVSEARLASAEANLIDAQLQLKDKISDSYTKADDAISNKVDQFFDNPSSDPQLTFVMSDFNLEKDIESRRSNLNSTLASLLTYSSSVDHETALITSSDVKANLNIVIAFLNKVAVAVNSLSPYSGLTQATIDSYKADVLTARTNLNTALTGILTAEEKVRSSQSSVNVAQQDLNLLNAGSTAEQIRIAEANVQKSEAAVLKSQVQINKSRIISPINGIIAKQDAKVGQTTSVNQHLVTVISGMDLQIEAQIPEVDIGRVRLGNDVRITIDAFGDQEFMGNVSYIDPAETVIDGVVNFKSNILITDVPENLRSGLTANLFIETNSKEDALVIPQFAILEKDEGTFVVKDVNGERVETEVTLGLRGSGGVIEVLSGVSEGDQLYNVGLRSN